MFYKRKPDAFIGPVCPYVLAPVVRWGRLCSFLLTFRLSWKFEKFQISSSNIYVKHLHNRSWATFAFQVRERLERSCLQHGGNGGHLQTERQGIQIPHVFRKVLCNFIFDGIIKLLKLTRSVLKEHSVIWLRDNAYGTKDLSLILFLKKT